MNFLDRLNLMRQAVADGRVAAVAFENDAERWFEIFGNHRGAMGCYYDYGAVDDTLAGFRCAVGATLTDKELRHVRKLSCNGVGVDHIASQGVLGRVSDRELKLLENIQEVHDKLLVGGLPDYCGLLKSAVFGAISNPETNNAAGILTAAINAAEQMWRSANPES